MSLNTRCPACETVFKVVPDQLKVSSGWVRCGRCAEVFDAATHMLAPMGGSVIKTVSPQLLEPTRAPMPSASPVTAHEAAAFKSAPMTQPAPSTPLDPIATQTHSRYINPATAISTQPDIDLDRVPELSFVRNAKNKAFWQQTAVVRVMLTAVLALGVLLAFQVVLDQRHQLAAKYPSMQTSLAALCAPLGCEIEAVKQLDALKIESSTFQKTQESPQGDTFALKVTLKNNATLPLAVPALELSLTDVNDKAVIRRVLSATDLGFQGQTLAALGEWNGVTSVFVSANATQNTDRAAVTGYRVLAFYP